MKSSRKNLQYLASSSRDPAVKKKAEEAVKKIGYILKAVRKELSRKSARKMKIGGAKKKTMKKRQ